MLSVTIQKDVNEYKPKILAGLTSRTLFCSAMAIIVALIVAWYCWFVLGLPYDITGPIVIVLSLPFWAAGFVHPYGMNLEKYVPLWFRQNFTNNVLIYKTTSYLDGTTVVSNAKKVQQKRVILEGRTISKSYEILTKRPDFEAYSPSEVILKNK